MIAEVKKTFPNKPIRYVINTHNHFDHLGGVRTFVAEGATLIAEDKNREFFKNVVLAPQPRTLLPDRLSQRPFAPTGPGQLMLQTFTDRYTISDGDQIIELYHVQNLNHSDNMVIAYLPKQKILVSADMGGPPAADHRRRRMSAQTPLRCTGTSSGSSSTSRPMRRFTAFLGRTPSSSGSWDRPRRAHRNRAVADR